MKIFNIILKVLLCLLMVSPILGALGIFPAPTADLYRTDEAFAFIDMLFRTHYIVYIQALVFAASIVLIIMKRTAIAALLITPITVCIIGFHIVLDGGLFVPDAIMADILLALNIYFLWQNRAHYKTLWDKSSGT